MARQSTDRSTEEYSDPSSSKGDQTWERRWGELNHALRFSIGGCGTTVTPQREQAIAHRIRYVRGTVVIGTFKITPTV